MYNEKNNEFITQALINSLAENGNVKQLKKELKHSTYKQNTTALFLGCYNGHLDVIKCLIQSGTDIHIDDDYVIVISAVKNHFNILKFLHEQGCSLSAHDNEVVKSASSKGHVEIIKYVLEHGGDISTVKQNANEITKKYIDSYELNTKLFDKLKNNLHSGNKQKI